MFTLLATALVLSQVPAQDGVTISGNTLTVDNVEFAMISPAPVGLEHGTQVYADSVVYTTDGTVQWTVAPGEYEVLAFAPAPDPAAPDRTVTQFTVTVEPLARLDQIRAAFAQLVEAQQALNAAQAQMNAARNAWTTLDPDFFEIGEALNPDN